MFARSLEDVRFAIRSLWKRPGFTIVAVLALALGIGANTAIFSAINTILLGPMPYNHPEQLVAVWEDNSTNGFPRGTPAPANYFDWKRMNHVFTEMAAIRSRVMNVTGSGQPELILGRGVTANFFDVLGARPMLGRVFTPEEDQTGAKVLVISYGLWQRRFAGGSDVVGRTLRLNDEPYTVVGVMPPGFAFPDRRYEFWDTIRLSPQQAGARGNHFLTVVARLKPGVALAQAQADMSAVAAQLAKQYPATNRKLGAGVVPLRDQLVGDTRPALFILFAAAVVVLLIACANVANLLLTRGAERARELAVRTALGAGRGQLVRQLVIESLTLSSAGALAGVFLGMAGMAALQALISKDLVNASTLTFNLPVLCFAILVSLASGFLFGLVPALRSSRLDVNEALKQGGRTTAGASSGLRKILVMSQVALALVLLSGAGLLIQTLANLAAVDLGFPADHLLTAATHLSRQSYDTDGKILSFSDRAIEKISQIPGVSGAGFASTLPFTSVGNTSGFGIQGRPPSPEDQFNDALYREVTSGYLQALGVRLISGRLLDDRDTASSQKSIVINETFARLYWPNTNPLGARVCVGDCGPKATWRTVVGVIVDVRERGLQLGAKSGVYLPFRQVQRPAVEYLLVRTTGDPAAVLSAVRQAISSVDPQQPLARIRTMDDYVRLETQPRKHQMNVFAIFAGLALFLAALGIYGILAYGVAQRRREIGVRMALGAGGASVTGLVLRQGLMLIVAGLATGGVLALVSLRAVKSLLFGVKPLDPAALSAAGAVLLVAGLMACLVPALNASRVDPIKALREE